MKSFSLAAVLSVGSFELAKATDYNGKIKYFIADIATTSPCHPKYERTFTWVDTSNGDAMDFVLNGIVDAGFNGIRLPMWPEDDRVRGPDPSNELRDIGREFCEDINRNWIERIRTASSEQKYGDLIIYMSPGLENKTFQADLSHSKYASWVVDYITAYEPSFVSPFNGNDSTLRSQSFSSSSSMSDAVTMWEMETLKKIKSNKVFKRLDDRPEIIGPDRATVEHTKNVINSFSGSESFIRPKYKSRVDIIGTQARYADPSATESNFNTLSGNGLSPAWCTLCSQEWYRQIDSSLGYNALRASQVPSGYWANYQEYWGLAQAPASQALAGNLQGFVAEAAIPRFVSKQGTVNNERNWGTFDRMVDTDSNRENFDLLASTENRNILKPLAGFRRSLLDPVDTNKCEVYDGVDRVLGAYESCSFEITERDYLNNKYEPIRLYVDTPRSVYAYIETCKTNGQQLCDTQEYYVGVEYLMKYAPDWYVRILFENDTNESNIFQIEALTATGEVLGAFQSIFALSTGAVALLCSAFLF